MAGDDFAIGALGFFAIKLNVCRAIGNLALRFGDGFAHLGSQDDGKVILIGHAKVKPFAHDLRAFLGGAARPFAVGGVGGGDGAGSLGPAKVRQVADHVATGGVGNREGRAVIGQNPLPGDVTFRHQKRRVFQK